MFSKLNGDIPSRTLNKNPHFLILTVKPGESLESQLIKQNLMSARFYLVYVLIVRHCC